MKYKVYTIATATIELGEIEADSKEEAIEKALVAQGDDTISLCYHCSQKVGQLVLSDQDEDIFVEELD